MTENESAEAGLGPAEKMYLWGGVATAVSLRRAEGYSLFGEGGRTTFAVLAPSREAATQAVNDLLGTLGGQAEWTCRFESVQERTANATRANFASFSTPLAMPTLLESKERRTMPDQNLTIPDAWITEWNVLFVIASPDGDQAPAVEHANKVLAEWDYPIVFDPHTFRENWTLKWVDPAVIAEESWPESGWSTDPVEGWVKIYRVDLDNLSEGDTE